MVTAATHSPHLQSGPRWAEPWARLEAEMLWKRDVLTLSEIALPGPLPALRAAALKSAATGPCLST